MGRGFWFFTDADRLAAQSSAEAFGPVVGNEATQFRVTDLHGAAAASAADADQPRAYAVCDGLLRARLDDEGGLTLILKPSQQPPFDFPPVAFFLYKGVRPDSLLKSAAPWPLVDPAKASQSPLVARIVQDWQANANLGEPSSKSLGLHLNPATPASAGFDPSLYGDLQPLDNLFYHGDGLFPPRLVSAGEPIGFFAATRFGLEVAIDRIGAPPLIGLATKRETIVTARAMPTGTPAADDCDAFMSRHERDALAAIDEVRAAAAHQQIVVRLAMKKIVPGTAPELIVREAAIRKSRPPPPFRTSSPERPNSRSLELSVRADISRLSSSGTGSSPIRTISTVKP